MLDPAVLAEMVLHCSVGSASCCLETSQADEPVCVSTLIPVEDLVKRFVRATTQDPHH